MDQVSFPANIVSRQQIPGARAALRFAQEALARAGAQLLAFELASFFDEAPGLDEISFETLAHWAPDGESSWRVSACLEGSADFAKRSQELIKRIEAWANSLEEADRNRFFGASTYKRPADGSCVAEAIIRHIMGEEELALWQAAALSQSARSARPAPSKPSL